MQQASIRTYSCRQIKNFSRGGIDDRSDLRRKNPMELPECPVCLEPYDGGHERIPRVLACGHTICEVCLANLPQRYPHTVRCPACTVLVKFPPQGPSSLPKNIDLLRLVSSSPEINPPKLDKTSQNPQQVHFLPRSWSDELYSSWKVWILPEDAVLMEQKLEHASSVGEEEVKVGVGGDGSSSSFWGRLREKGKVSLVRVGSLLRDSNSIFKLSYIERIMNCLFGMSERERDELSLILKVSMKLNRICTVFGLWGNLEDGFLYLVSERMGTCLDELGDLSEDGLTRFAMIGMELSEALIGLHSEGLIAGHLGSSCISFDNFGHGYVDLKDVLEMGRKVIRNVLPAGSSDRKLAFKEVHLIFNGLFKQGVFMSPEVLLELLHREGICSESISLKSSVGLKSDAWPLGCVLLRLLIGKQLTDGLVDCVHCLSVKDKEEVCVDYLASYMNVMQKAETILTDNFGKKYESLQRILCDCLNPDPANRPLVSDVWKCVRELIVRPDFDIMAKLDATTSKEKSVHCLALGEFCRVPKERYERPEIDQLWGKEHGCETDHCGETEADKSLVEGLSDNSIKSKVMQGHLDCVTGLAVGGDFLFSSSFDKSIHVWSLKDFTHLHTFLGHEHKVMALVYLDVEQPLCISGDSGGGVFLWSTSTPLSKEPLRKWYEPNDWRYSGIHALTVSDNGYIYTGCGDKTIKVWSLQDGTLSYTMIGHRSVVSTLVVCNGVLYSGSWDGTIRLWSLNDHGLLTVLGENTSGTLTSVLSLTADNHTLVATHENGSIKVWTNDVLMKSLQTHSGAILTAGLEGKWLFTGGWDKTVNVQELTGDELQVDARPVGSIPCASVITTLLYWQGKLFVGHADRTVKVYYYGR